MPVNMQTVFKIFIIVIILFNTKAQAQIQKSLIGYQNIPWGTKLSSIKNKNPKLLIADLCLNWPQGRELAKKEDFSCRRLVDKNFSILSVKMELEFKFDYQEKLNLVTLEYIPNALGFELNEIEKHCTETFDKLHHLIVTKYGDSLEVSNETPIFPYKKSEFKAWLPLPTEIWLAKSFGSEVNILSSCSVKINYRPRQHFDANKI
jgi:hypothetical protein